MRNLGTVKKVLCGGALGLYEMAYREWGNENNPNVLLCVHGLTRNSLDFCELGEALSHKYRVIAPDIAGRGLSDNLTDPMRYDNLNYTYDLITLIAKLGVSEVDWLGTSMGGLLGMFLASQEKSPIRRLILNDVGPTMSIESLERITNYVGAHSKFSNFEEAYTYLRKILAPMSMETEDEWNVLVNDSLKSNNDGTYVLNYDPLIKMPLKKTLLGTDINLWPLYDLIKVPTLVINGDKSDLLSKETALEMTKRGPKAKLVTVPNVGHAPMFKNLEQIGIIMDFLRNTPYQVRT